MPEHGRRKEKVGGEEEGELGVSTVAQIENKVLLPDAQRGSSSWSSSSAATNKPKQ